MGKTKAVIILLLITLSLSSCKSSSKELPDYFSGHFICELSWEIPGERMHVKIEAEPKKDNEKRNIKIEFLYPDTLSGIIITRRDGKVYAIFDDMELMGSFEGFLEIEKLFESDVQIKEVSNTTLGGDVCSHFITENAFGEELSVYISNKTELPVKLCTTVCQRKIEADVISFETK